MANDWGVYQDGTDLWVKVVSPLQLSSADQALLSSQSDAMILATYLNSGGAETYSVGRPDDRHPH